MNHRETVFYAIAGTLLLLVMTWGNAAAMMIASLAGLVTGLILFRSNRILIRLMLAALGLGSAAAVVVALILRSRGY